MAANTSALPRRLFTAGAVAALLSTGACASAAGTALNPAIGSAPVTALHYAANGRWGTDGFYEPAKDGFNLADVDSVSLLSQLPVGVKALVWLGLCGGADAQFLSTVRPYVGQSRVWGFYLTDEPDPTGRYKPRCPQSKLKAESEWIHGHDPGAKTFVVLMSLASSAAPSYEPSFTPANSDIDYYGLDPYPCRTERHGCDYALIGKAVAAAEASGVPTSDVVPVYQAFGGGSYIDDGGGHYQLPTPVEERRIMATWARLVPRPVFDYAYSWGVQHSDTVLSTASAALRAVFTAHNRKK